MFTGGGDDDRNHGVAVESTPATLPELRAADGDRDAAVAIQDGDPGQSGESHLLQDARGMDGVGPGGPDPLRDHQERLAGVLAVPALQAIAAAIVAAWPEQPAKALAVGACESSGGRDPRTWDMTRVHSGPLQIARAVWERYFLERYGWSWEEIVMDPVIHARAAREIYDRAGGWSPWPICGK